MDQNLCNESWHEIEIANIQTNMANMDICSNEYNAALANMYTLSQNVIDIEKIKLDRDIYKEKYILKAAEIAEILLIGGFAMVLCRRIFK